MVYGVRWADIEEIRKASTVLRFEDEEYDACGLPLCWNGDTLSVDNQNTNTIIYGSMISDIERFYTMPLVDIIIRAMETFVVVDSSDRVYNGIKKLDFINQYNVIDGCREDWYQNWQSALLNNNKTVLFIRLNDQVHEDIKLVYETIKHDNNQRITFLLNNFVSLPRIKGLTDMLSDIEICNVRFYLLGCEEHRLKELYGIEAESIKNRCENWVFMNSRVLSFLKEISELCGHVYEDNHYKPLISVSELQRLKKEEVLVMYKNLYPYITKMLSWEEYCQRKRKISKRKQLLDKLDQQFDGLFIANVSETDMGEDV